MTAIFQTIFSNAFSWMKMYKFRLRFHWSLLPGVRLTIFQYWFRQWLGADQATSHCLDQWWLIYWRMYASLGIHELMACMAVLYHLTIQLYTWGKIAKVYNISLIKLYIDNHSHQRSLMTLPKEVYIRTNTQWKQSSYHLQQSPRANNCHDINSQLWMEKPARAMLLCNTTECIIVELGCVSTIDFNKSCPRRQVQYIIAIIEANCELIGKEKKTDYSSFIPLLIPEYI